MSDGGLRQLFRRNLPEFHWVTIESGSTARGIPDSEFCCRGVTGWIEYKSTLAWTVWMRVEQVAFIERRLRSGGRAFLAVRRRCPAGPRRGPAVDELWLLVGAAARGLVAGSLRNVDASHVLGRWGGGPVSWRWSDVADALAGA